MTSNKKRKIKSFACVVLAIAFALLPCGVLGFSRMESVNVSAQTNGLGGSSNLTTNDTVGTLVLTPSYPFSITTAYYDDGFENNVHELAGYTQYSFEPVNVFTDISAYYQAAGSLYNTSYDFTYPSLYTQPTYRQNLLFNSGDRVSYPTQSNISGQISLDPDAATPLISFWCYDKIIPFNFFEFWAQLDPRVYFYELFIEEPQTRQDYPVVDASFSALQIVDGTLERNGFNISGDDYYLYFSEDDEAVIFDLGLLLFDLFDFYSDYAFNETASFVYVESLEVTVRSSGLRPQYYTYAPEFDVIFNDYMRILKPELPAQTAWLYADMLRFKQNALDSIRAITGRANSNPAAFIFDTVDEFFDLELFPGFKMSYLLYISVAGLVIGFAIKIFLQG